MRGAHARLPGGFGGYHGLGHVLLGFADALEVDVDGLVGLVADELFLVDEERGDGGDEARGAVFVGEVLDCHGEGHEGGVASVDEGVPQRAGEGGDEDFGAVGGA